MANVKISALPASAGAALADLAAIVDDPAGTPVTQKATLQQIFDIDPWFKKVGTAFIGGNDSGNARGANALDIQQHPDPPSTGAQVASGARAIALGVDNIAAGQECCAIGSYTDAHAYKSSAFGSDSVATGSGSGAFGSVAQSQAAYSFAVGTQAIAFAAYSAAFGYSAQNRIERTVNFGGFNIIRKDNNEPVGVAPWVWGGMETVIFSDEVNLETVAEQTVTLPAGCHFFFNEVGVVATVVSGLVTQPTVRFGWTGTLAGLIAATVTADLTAAFARQRYLTLLTAAGQTSLTAGVTSAANATTMLGRFYWKGILLEDE